jgi:hypothetical protein
MKVKKEVWKKEKTERIKFKGNAREKGREKERKK